MIHSTHTIRRVRGMQLGALGITTSSEIGTSLDAAAGIVAVAVPVIGPIIGAGVAAAASLIQAFGLGNGCGSTCSATTQVVNQIIPMMQQNLAAAQAQAQANGGCLNTAEQSAAIQTFGQLWQTIVAQCTQIGGPGGKNCIADRQRGGKYDCFVTLLDPIAAIPVCIVAPAILPGVSAAAGIAGTAAETGTAAAGSPSVASSVPSAPFIAGIPNGYLYAAAALVALMVMTK